MLEKLYKELLENFMDEITKKENQEKLKNRLIDPLIMHILNKIYPYIFITTSVFVLLLILLFSILYFVIRKS